MNHKPLKVLHIITRLDKGGSADVVLGLAKGLKERGEDVSIVVGKTMDPHTDLSAYVERTGIGIISIPFLRRDVNPFLDMLALLQLFFIIRRERPDILHTHTSKAGFLGRLAGRMAGAKVIVHTPHGHILYGYYGRILTRLFLYLEGLASYLSDRVITLTDNEAQEYVKWGVTRMEKLVTIPCGIELERFPSLTEGNKIKREFGIPGDTPLVGWVGRLEPVKGCGYFLRACAIIKNVVPGVRFLIAGDGPLMGDMKVLAEGLGLKGDVIFAGFREDIPEIISSIDLLVHTPLNEGLGRVLLEAMACGKPIVVTRVGGVPEVVEDGVNGLLIPSGDVEAIAEASIRILKDNALGSGLGKAGKKKVAEFGMDRMVEVTYRLYKSMMDS